MVNDNQRLNELVEYLKDCLRSILSDGSEWQEFRLLKELHADERLGPLLTPVAGDSLTLYRAHFLLFHALYRLADELSQSQQALLEISPLSINWHHYQAGQQHMAKPDAVREYYLDWQNYDTTDAQRVDELIASFWVGLHKLDNRDEALSALGLTDPVNDATIRKTYQRLVMQHHPDRGGDEEKIQELNLAIQSLLK